MPSCPLPSVREILADRVGEEMALNNRYLNQQMGRIVKTVGFDRVWVRGEGAHLIDSRGERYLDLFGGHGVFAIGRNHPEAVAAIQDVLAASTANLPQAGRDAAERRARGAVARTRSEQRRRDDAR